jgi:hypothetical protein
MLLLVLVCIALIEMLLNRMPGQSVLPRHKSLILKKTSACCLHPTHAIICCAGKDVIINSMVTYMQAATVIDQESDIKKMLVIVRSVLLIPLDR